MFRSIYTLGSMSALARVRAFNPFHDVRFDRPDEELDGADSGDNRMIQSSDWQRIQNYWRR